MLLDAYYLITCTFRFLDWQKLSRSITYVEFGQAVTIWLETEFIGCSVNIKPYVCAFTINISFEMAQLEPPGKQWLVEGKARLRAKCSECLCAQSDCILEDVRLIFRLSIFAKRFVDLSL